MASITFNIIIIRVYQDRLHLTDSNADTGDANRDKTLSGLRFRTAHSTANGTIPESQASRQGNKEGRAEQDETTNGTMPESQAPPGE
jgi:hypothetical protein